MQYHKFTWYNQKSQLDNPETIHQIMSFGEIDDIKKMEQLIGIKKIKELSFVVKTRQVLNPGDRVGLSKFGHKYICSFNLIADTRNDLQARMRKIEKSLDIQLVK